MAGIIPEEIISEVRQRTDIVQVIGQHVQLRRAGNSFLGLCPFHEEKTPSFNVNPQRQFYHCFGCHESGDVFKFLMKVEGRHFTEVVEDLAARAGVELRHERSSKGQVQEAARRRSERQSALELNERVAALYEKLLASGEGEAAREYLERRGVRQATTAVFRLGLAPASGSQVTRLLRQEKLSVELAERLGLVSKRRGRDGYFDRFWNRLIFPVCGAGGEVLAFGGRLLGDGDGPKYINSPESSLYRKGETLYGLQQATPHVRRRGKVILVEGNVDVVQMYQQGFQHTLAPMGTALTPGQMRTLARMAPALVALFDGDNAGQAAALKAIPLLVESGMDARIATLPPGQDPDSFLLQHGAEAMASILEKAIPAVDFLIEHHLNSSDGTIPGKDRLLTEVVPVIAKIPGQFSQDLYAGRLATLLDIKQETVLRALKGGKPVLRTEAARAQQKPTAPLSPGDQTALSILGILKEHPHLVGRVEQARVTSLLTNDSLHATYIAAIRMLADTGTIDAARLLEVTEEQLRNAVAGVLGSDEWASDGDPTRALDACITRMEISLLERELQEIRTEMARANKEGDEEMERILAVRMREVAQEITDARLAKN